VSAPVVARPQRSDARRNRERVLAAAEAAFAEMGLRAQVEEVARRAGLGVGTVCRHFPTKQALVEAVLAEMYDSLLAESHAALASDAEPGAAFEAYLFALAAFQARHRALAESMADAIELPTATQATRQALRDAISELVARAQAAGALRDDIGPADVTLLFSAIAHTTAHAGELQPALRDRYVTLVLDALRPQGATPLPGKPIDFAQFDRLKKRRLLAQRTVEGAR
jgi:AcrR family transcriptional regulator